MGEYNIKYNVFDVDRSCEECLTHYQAGYEFMECICCCGVCTTTYLICLTCSPMYMKCSCGCNGVYSQCNQRPTNGKMRVIFFFFF